MNCRRVESLLGDYLDGALSFAERRAIEDHFADCPGCAAVKDDMDFAIGFLDRAPTVETPEGLVANILDATVNAEPPAGGMAVAGAGAMSWARPFLQPLFEPRFAMSLALAAVSFSILTWSGQKTLDRWGDADPMAQVRTATTSLDQAWERSVEVYQRTFSAEESETRAPEPAENASPHANTPVTP